MTHMCVYTDMYVLYACVCVYTVYMYMSLTAVLCSKGGYLGRQKDFETTALCPL